MTSGDQLVSTPAAGVYLTASDFEAVIDGLRSGVSALDEPLVRRSLRAPPVIARSVIEMTGYQQSFPHLLGRVYARTAAGQLGESDLVLLPAACYSVYPGFAGQCLDGPTGVSIEATCFRQEDRAEPGRLRSFRMREFVWLGGADECRGWRDDRLASASDWLAELGLATTRAVASDPFFGSGGRMLANFQKEEELKIEIVAEVAPGVDQAIASGNCHKDQFGRLFEIRGTSGDVAHSACMAFGYERIALALFHRHGAQTRNWPEQVRKSLRMEASQ